MLQRVTTAICAQIHTKAHTCTLRAEPWTSEHQNLWYTYRDADKSLARPGRKQAQKHVREERDFNNIETRAVIIFFPARHGAEGNSRHSDRNIRLVSFLVGLRTYQHLCSTNQSAPKRQTEPRWSQTRIVDCFLNGAEYNKTIPMKQST